ncbi:MAG TPA: bifunctional diaminohydroxyphosphoribosylaminopyrimidine deaminase/5-amino-6-(5-phosphoribosylamino)uracil reductase RibD [Acidisoma sp.]|uniref:bifunctional diaminohydroxyphosphoribosylaminopyrimidine deaminase/5-amino-6-(5-phosphoribosylamino)uracil reductase RibD n=1 Tax=Acidisoma sp. TaxID=1872115 RepID=UPI002CB55B79|nr:bifunctional diaminohydroxyphosphoribosylaminopyrimidine deaminase/5-amino-6-(5-phosphoribosylamino)uracil reductase RibD [Acidisoma sp.]HTI00195.1 bifunctional diaminohydroxyphosphoribosylaminopyrimidine deaminase/5-amino-6-(5-phosphoribosylamino)uracil reductase RibD [Acidisoma sp.]
MTGWSALDRRMMLAALTVARGALGTTAPNPAVGCVIAQGEAMISRGATQPGGRPHAEVMALAAAGAAARGATAYVTLEPCSHHGRTPPCAEALIAAGVARVVVAFAHDPDPRVQGRGIAMLRAAGIAVDTGLMERDAAEILRGFLKAQRQGLPWVTVKLGVSLDGCIATRSGESRWITGPGARTVVQRMRAEHDAVMVGIGTVLADDPGLRCGLPGLGDRPRWRVVADAALRTPLTSQIVRHAAAHSLILLAAPEADAARAAALRAMGVAILTVPRAASGGLDLGKALAALKTEGLTSILNEGGAKLAGALLRAGLVDRIAWHRAPILLGDSGLQALQGLGIERLADAIRLRLLARQEYEDDVLETYEIRSPVLGREIAPGEIIPESPPAVSSGPSA